MKTIYKVAQNESIDLEQFPTALETDFSKKELKKSLKNVVKEMDDLQYNLYAEDRQSLLIVFQGIDAAGKDSSIRAIFSGLNPVGVVVSSFKTPSYNELEHDYLWRHYLRLPNRGNIRIFNRSHYENVIVTKVHPEYLLNERLPNIRAVEDVNEAFFEERYQDINHFEQHLIHSGTQIIKFFLYISKDTQKERFLGRLEENEKNYKFSMSDFKEREYWEDYIKAYNTMLSKTSMPNAPWYIVPCDNKKAAQLEMAKVIHSTLTSMNPQPPSLSAEEKNELQQLYNQLKS